MELSLGVMMRGRNFGMVRGRNFGAGVEEAFEGQQTILAASGQGVFRSVTLPHSFFLTGGQREGLHAP
jgi:hypothetical protein